MPLSQNAKTKAILLIIVVVPALMFGLGAASFLIARAAGLGNDSIWIALVMSTIGFIVSIVLTLRVGKSFEQKGKL